MINWAAEKKNSFPLALLVAKLNSIFDDSQHQQTQHFLNVHYLKTDLLVTSPVRTHEWAWVVNGPFTEHWGHFTPNFALEPSLSLGPLLALYIFVTLSVGLEPLSTLDLCPLRNTGIERVQRPTGEASSPVPLWLPSGPLALRAKYHSFCTWCGLEPCMILWVLNCSAYALHGHLSASCRNLGGISQNFALPRATILSQRPFFPDKSLISHKTVYGNIVPEEESHVNSLPVMLMSNQLHHPG